MWIHNIPVWTFDGTLRLRDFEKRTEKQLREKALLKRLREINAAVNERAMGDREPRSSWATMMNGTRGFRNRRSNTDGSEAA
jgi:hypothetical protein